MKQFIAICTQTETSCELDILDLGLKIYSSTFIAAMAQARLYVLAIYCSFAERGVDISQNISYNAALEKCKGNNQFVTYVDISQEV